MSRLAALRAAQNLHDVAHLLNFTAKGLAFILYVKPKSTRYHEFEIDKKSGGKRKISAPDVDLLRLQKRLSNLLQTCDGEIRNALKLKRTIAHGFVPEKSIMTNAQEHLSRRMVLNVDIEDFFGSINFGRVRGFFIKNRSFALHPDVATIVAQIVCHDNKLPQGAPTSPVVSNLLTHILDVKLAQLSSKVGCTYTRYADDLTFSTNLRTFPPELAVPEDEHLWVAGQALKAAVVKQGFVLNEKKTRLQYRASRQSVTGLVVNKEVSVPADFRRHLRQMVHRLCLTNTVSLAPGVAPVPADNLVMRRLHGMLSYVYLVKNFERSRRLSKKNETIPTSSAFAKLYIRFLLYKDFFTSDRPVFLMEGKTDNIYLWCAIRQLAGQLPALVTAATDGKLTLVPRLFRNSKTTGELLGLSGGTGGLANFLGIYCEAVKKFGATESQSPIILLIDNDEGATALYTFLAQMNKPKGKGKGKQAPGGNGKKGGEGIDGMQPFYRVGDHVYIVPTPKADPKAQSCMENLFSAETLASVIDGKSFNIHEDTDGQTHYGKFAFAKMVKAKEKTTEFKGFLPFLTVVNDIVANHGKAAPASPAPVAPVVT
jgi:hypothetical protein